MKPNWLTKCIIAVTFTIGLLAGGWSGSCLVATFTNNPLAEQETCKNHDDRAIQVMLGLLATLISLKSNPPTETE